MNILKTTLISHIFNEEYLLPFWLEHHKDMFDDIIIIDYNSTDNSIEICKNICPRCQIIKTRNLDFGAIEVDNEIMDIENNIEGIKMVLNTTEFLFCESTINDIFMDITNPISISVMTNTPYSLNSYNINNYNELINNLLNNDIFYHYDRGVRQLHTFPNGNYNWGRHETRNNFIYTEKAHIIWLGFFPMNDNLMKRKLQIQQNMPESDKIAGLGIQHLYDKEKIISINHTKSNTGKPLNEINLSLYNLLKLKYYS